MLNKDVNKRLYGYLKTILGMRDYRRGWLKGNCPSCGKADKFGVNLSLFRTNCFSCEYNPNPIKLVMEVEGLMTYQEAHKLLGSYEDSKYVEPVIKRIEKITLELPESYRNILLGNNFIAKSARNYVSRRGFNIEDVSLKGWGYCSSGEYQGYLIMPFYMGGNLVYFNARRFMGSGPKYKNPNIEKFGVGKSMVMYNADALAIYDKVYLAEGLFNADTIGDQGMASGGKKVSNWQVSMILGSKVNEVILVLDPDAIQDAIKIGLGIVFHKRVKILRLPDNQDVNDLGKEFTLELEKSTPYLTYQDLLKLKHNEERPIFTYH